jgi:cysteine desulfuration protein SufE
MRTEKKNETPEEQEERKRREELIKQEELKKQEETIIRRNKLNQRQDEIIDMFSGIDDWMDKYALLIDIGNALEPLDEQLKTPQNLITGCQSRVWLYAEEKDDLIYFRGDSDAVMVRGLVSMLVSVFSGYTPDEIITADLYFIDQIGLWEHLSPTRSNGLRAMAKQMRLYAVAIKAKREKMLLNVNADKYDRPIFVKREKKVRTKKEGTNPLKEKEN